MAALLSGLGGLVGGIFGDISANSAGKKIASTAGAASNAVGTAGNQAAAATNLGVTGVQGATTAGVSGIQGATQNGQQGVTQGALAAQTAAGNIYGGELQNLQPYNTTGATGSNALNGLVQQGFQAPTAAQAAATPGEQFALQEGEQATLQALGATGGAATGGAEKALTQYGQNVASTYYQQAFNNAQSAYNTNVGAASTAAGQGLQGAGLTNQAAQNFTGLTEQNTLGANQYNAGLGLQGATAAGGLGLQGAGTALSGMETAGNQNLQGTQAASQFALTGAEGAAAGQLAGAQQLTGGLSSLGNGLGSFFGMGSTNPYGIPGTGFGNPGYSAGQADQINNMYGANFGPGVPGGNYGL